MVVDTEKPTEDQLDALLCEGWEIVEDSPAWLPDGTEVLGEFCAVRDDGKFTEAIAFTAGGWLAEIEEEPPPLKLEGADDLDEVRRRVKAQCDAWKVERTDQADDWRQVVKPARQMFDRFKATA